jgi:hypothetical protein
MFWSETSKLEKNYREWLERDVIYLINKEERDAFRRLATNEARDKFIEDFEIREPNPWLHKHLQGRNLSAHRIR